MLIKRRFIDIEDYFGFTGSITKKDIPGIALLAGNNDGWHIDSIVTYVAVNEFNWELSSVDLEAHRWVDGDSSYTYKVFALTLVVLKLQLIVTLLIINSCYHCCALL